MTLVAGDTSSSDMTYGLIDNKPDRSLPDNCTEEGAFFPLSPPVSLES